MLWTVSPRDGSRCRHFSSCRSISQSEDEDEAQHCNCTMPQMQKSLINFKPLQDPAAKFNASLDYLPAHQERVRWKGHSHRFTGCTSATFFFSVHWNNSTEQWIMAEHVLCFCIGQLCWFNHVYLRRPITDICAPLPRSTVELHLAKVMLKHDEKGWNTSTNTHNMNRVYGILRRMLLHQYSC